MMLYILSGNDSNNGRDPYNAVRTLAAAYKLLDKNKSAEQNKIVLIGNYKDSYSSNVFNKPSTISGSYAGVNYKGCLKLSDTKLLSNTIFKDITLDCDNNDKFIYCQGNNLTMDKNVSIKNSTGGKTEWGLPNSNYSGISIFGGWLNYVAGTPFPNEVCNITIKSGCYRKNFRWKPKRWF